MPPDTESPHGREHPAQKKVGWWIGALSGLAGIAGLIFGFTQACEPEGPTAEEWREKANAVCEQQLLTVDAALSSAVQWAAHLSRQAAAGSATPSDVDHTASATRSAANSLQYFVGSLRAIDQPDAMKDDIQRALDTGSDITGALNAAAKGLQSGDLAEASRQLAAVQQGLAPWTAQMRALEASRCAR
ncbi:hypothetical protein [Streptomyces sp. NPDC047974]|uniref:hypothetical protein n=1 Tax=Streptomyces sp. NPDC047974 TaxID=3154343 RepID=UPI0033E872C9